MAVGEPHVVAEGTLVMMVEAPKGLPVGVGISTKDGSVHSTTQLCRSVQFEDTCALSKRSESNLSVNIHHVGPMWHRLA